MLNLPPVPAFQLSLPALSVQAAPRRQDAASWLPYRDFVVPREWRDVPDDELRLEVETGRLDLGQLSLIGQINTVPGRERDCQPDCRSPGWSSSLRLKYDSGDLGPLRQAGPELSVGWTPAHPGLRSQGLVRGGFSAKF